jgi:TolB-like protein
MRLSANEMADVEVIGTVNTTFTSFQWFHFYTKKGVGKKAYKKLKEEAQYKYRNNIDVVNVNAQGKFSGWELLMIYPGYPIVWLGNYQKVYATGDVISTDSNVAVAQQTRLPDETRIPKTDNSNIPRASKITTGLERAAKKVVSTMINELPNGSKIAVVNVASDDKSTSSLVIDEVEFHLVSTKRFTIVDRSTLDLIQKEQQFQMSGDVDDKDVVKIGSLSGANVVIAGSVIKSGNSNRLSLKALDVKTGQIITMARESY